MNCWQLLYNNNDESLFVIVWSTESLPNVDMEGMRLTNEQKIQGGQAMTYHKEGTDTNMLLWTMNDYIVQIMGDVTTGEIEKIAENFLF